MRNDPNRLYCFDCAWLGRDGARRPYRCSRTRRPVASRALRRSACGDFACVPWGDESPDQAALQA